MCGVVVSIGQQTDIKLFENRYLPGDEGVLTFLESGETFGGLPCSPDAAVNWGEDILVFEGKYCLDFYR